MFSQPSDFLDEVKHLGFRNGVSLVFVNFIKTNLKLLAAEHDLLILAILVALADQLILTAYGLLYELVAFFSIQVSILIIIILVPNGLYVLPY